jgi:mRNA interferase MazF
VLIIQNDVGNKFSPTVIVLAITSQLRKTNLPTHVEIPAGTTGLLKPSIVLAEQMRTLEKQRLQKRMGELSVKEMELVDNAIRSSLGFQAVSV